MDVSSLLWPTKIQSVVRSEKLVWAPNYRYGNTLFPARVCEPSEAQSEWYIKNEPAVDEVCVEIINAPRTPKNNNRLVFVKQKALVPYEGKTAQGFVEWCPILMNHVKDALNNHNRHNKEAVTEIYNQIRTSAKDYLLKAVDFDEDLARSEQHVLSWERPRNATPSRVSIPMNSADVDGYGLGKSDIKLEVSSMTGAEDLVTELSVGDTIAYNSELDYSVVVKAKIVGFSDNPHAPLLLSNEAHLVPTKRVRIIETVQGPVKGKFQALNVYVLNKGEGNVYPAEAAAATRSVSRKRKSSCQNEV